MRLLSLVLSALAVAGAAACGQAECLPYSLTTPAPTFIGTYDCEQKDVSTACQDYALCEGPTTLQVAISGSTLTVGKTDCQGYYYEFSGGVCEPEEKKTTLYRFQGRRDVSSADADPRAYYRLYGTFSDKGAASTASGSIQLIIQSTSGGANCTLNGTLTCTCRDCGS
ncbi:MAG: hypothetical protein QM765_31320 [Myxococcales bacterium]